MRRIDLTNKCGTEPQNMLMTGQHSLFNQSAAYIKFLEILVTFTYHKIKTLIRTLKIIMLRLF